jgi:N-acetyl-anhydromuramyl-L-alanine amidase AmpD
MGRFVACHPDCIRERKSGVTVDRLIIHRAQGYLPGIIATFKTGKDKRPIATATHFAVGLTKGKIDVVQFAFMSKKLIHAGSTIQPYWNDRSVGVELEGFVGQAWPPEVIKAVAELARDYILPAFPAILADRTHIVGHAEVPHRPTDSFHTDPGVDFPWSEFMAILTTPDPDDAKVDNA